MKRMNSLGLFGGSKIKPLMKNNSVNNEKLINFSLDAPLSPLHPLYS
jgi:hypothetical protein